MTLKRNVTEIEMSLKQLKEKKKKKKKKTLNIHTIQFILTGLNRLN